MDAGFTWLNRATVEAMRACRWETVRLCTRSNAAPPQERRLESKTLRMVRTEGSGTRTDRRSCAAISVSRAREFCCSEVALIRWQVPFLYCAREGADKVS